MIIKFTLDRFEGDFAVCLDEGENKHDIPKALVSHLAEGSIFTANVENGSYYDPVFLKEETEEKTKALKARLNRLFNK